VTILHWVLVAAFAFIFSSHGLEHLGATSTIARSTTLGRFLALRTLQTMAYGLASSSNGAS